MPITRPNTRLRRNIIDALPKADPDGLILDNTFVSYSDLHHACADLMHPINEREVEQELGKMHYSKDPTYNMRRGKR